MEKRKRKNIVERAKNILTLVSQPPCAWEIGALLNCIKNYVQFSKLKLQEIQLMVIT